MKRVLYLVACSIDLTGTPVFVRDLTEALDAQYEILVYTPSQQTKRIYSDRVKLIEGRCSGKSFGVYREIWKSLQHAFKNHEIDVVHINTANLLFTATCINFFYGKVPVIICHSHNVIHYKNDFAHRLWLPAVRNNIKKKADILLACSEAAGSSMFGSGADFRVLHNFIDTRKFCFSPQARQKIRKNITAQYVLGHIGVFNTQKNQQFLIRLAEKLDERFCLMLIGDGRMKLECRKYCAEHHIENVSFIDACENVHEYYSAFDMFLLPSRAEGFGRVLLEAEVSNLNKIVSDHVPHSDAFACTHLPLDEDLWVQEIYAQAEKLNERTDNSDRIRQKGFDTESIVAELTAFYGA